MATSKLANAINETTKAGVTDVEVFNDAVAGAGLDLEPYQAKPQLGVLYIYYSSLYFSLITLKLSPSLRIKSSL